MIVEFVNEQGFSAAVCETPAIIERYRNTTGMIEVPVCTEIFYIKKWNFQNKVWFEGATPEEIAEANKPIVPETISRMRFIIQVFLTTGIKYEEIVAFIQNLPTEVIDEASKYIVLTRLRSCTHLDRNSTDFNLIADMMGITTEQRDEIFINGNL